MVWENLLKNFNVLIEHRLVVLKDRGVGMVDFNRLNDLNVLSHLLACQDANHSHGGLAVALCHFSCMVVGNG